MAKVEELEGGVLDVYTPEEVKGMFDRDEIVLIDVRTPAEYAFEHIAGAMLFPLSGFDPAKLPAEDAKRIVFHCGSGMRSKKVAQRCASAGIGRTAHLEGGFGAWKAAGLPFTAVDPGSGGLVKRP